MDRAPGAERADAEGLNPMRVAVAAWRLGVTSPSRCSWARQRIALDGLTPNRSAAARHDNPPSIAPTTRRRRTTDKALAMQASLLAGIRHESEPSRFGNSSRIQSDEKTLQIGRLNGPRMRSACRSAGAARKNWRTLRGDPERRTAGRVAAASIHRRGRRPELLEPGLEPTRGGRVAQHGDLVLFFALAAHRQVARSGA